MWPFKPRKHKPVPADIGREIGERVWRLYGPEIDPRMATALELGKRRPRQERVIYGKRDACETYFIALFSGAYAIAGRVRDEYSRNALLAAYWKTSVTDGSNPDDADEELWRRLLDPDPSEKTSSSKVYPESERGSATRDAWARVKAGTRYYTNVASSARKRDVASAVDEAFVKKVPSAYPGRGVKIFTEVVGVVEKMLAGHTDA